MNLPMKKYDITQCALYKCRNKKRLEKLLLLEENQLKQIPKYIKYYNFPIHKKDGDKREITAPCEKIKKIQRRILKLLIKVYRYDWLISGEKGKSYLDNAKIHQYSNYFLTIDIRKFYDNGKREYVFRFFTDKLQMSYDCACILTDICTLDEKIPTGSPTSQMIAFYAYENMFNEISLVAEKYGCKFTLYVDDMTFSSINPFDPKKLTNEIDIILRKYKHKPKYEKVIYYPKSSFKYITGSIITSNNKLMVPNNLREKVYTGFITLKENAYNKNDDKKLNTLKGQLLAAKNIEPDIFKEINRLVQDKKSIIYT